MSNLLDQAIVDAKALKEVAMRNAEATILDKFSNQIKEAVEQILEADEDFPGEEGDEGIEGLEAGALGAGEEEGGEGEEQGSELSMPLASAEGVEMCACPDETFKVDIDLQNLEADLDSMKEPGESLEAAEMIGAEEEEEAGFGDLGALLPENLEFDQNLLEDLLDENSEDYSLEEDLLDELAQMVEVEGPAELEEVGGSTSPPYRSMDAQYGSDPEPPGMGSKIGPAYPGLTSGAGAHIRNKPPATPSIFGGGGVSDQGPPAAKRDNKRKGSKKELDEDSSFFDPATERAEGVEAAAQTSAAPYVAATESIDINEDDLNEIVEALTVDIDPLKTERSGWLETPQSVFHLAEEELLAMLEDSERREQHDAMTGALKKLQESHNKLKSDVEKLNADKKELVGVANRLKNKLTESNLANAKLLYTNKVLIGDSLNERQKNKIVEALSNSENIEEAKVIYETLQSATGSTIKNKKPESLSEALNKATSTVILSHRQREREDKTIQDDSSVSRWKILAGLNKK